MAEPNLPKKLKTEKAEIQYYVNFFEDKKNQNLIRLLRTAMSEFELGHSGLSVSFLRIRSSNASMFAETFSNARLQVEMVRDELGAFVIAPIALFFLQGFTILKEFLDTDDPKIPEDLMKRRALRDFLQYVTGEEHLVFMENNKEEKEWALAVRYAQHLLVPLMQQKTFVIDSYPGLQLDRCCSVRHPMNGVVGDTSFGCVEGWHGEVDIMVMDKEVPLSVVGGREDSDTASSFSDSTVEVKKDDGFTSSGLQQIMAQTIVFSFLQHKQNSGIATNLVPGIGICAEKMIVYLYDCVEDVFLEAFPLDLYVEKGQGIGVLNIRAVVVLWLVLNYGLFGNRIPDKLKKHKSEFHEVLGPKYLDMYMNKVGKPCHVKSSEKVCHEPHWERVLCCEKLSAYVSECLPETKFISLSTH